MGAFAQAPMRSRHPTARVRACVRTKRHHRTGRHIEQKTAQSRQGYGESDPPGGAPLILTGLRHGHRDGSYGTHTASGTRVATACRNDASASPSTAARAGQQHVDPPRAAPIITLLTLRKGSASARIEGTPGPFSVSYPTAAVVR
jgi:hypothetical protein